MYADDLILLSISVSDLQSMFKICENVFCNSDLSINVSKCHCLRIGPRFSAECKPLVIQGCDVAWVEKTKFLGMTICKAVTFKCCWIEAKNKYYRNINIILGRLGPSAPVSAVSRNVGP